MSAPQKPASRVVLALLLGAALYAGFAYGIAPWAWRHHERQAGLAGKAMVTTTKLGIPGDALNVGFEGGRDDILCAMRQAGWRAADPVTLASSAEIVGSVLARRAYDTAPVSTLYYDGRRQNLAFEKPSGKSPRTRHHVRFWKVLEVGDDGLPVWLGAATFDRSVGLSHYTGQVTHHIAPDIDAERNLLASDLAATGHVESTYFVSGIGPTLLARNGGGDRYFTDGEVLLSKLRPGCEARSEPPAALASPPWMKARTMAFEWLAKLWRRAP
jgi:LssY C-terminus